MKYTLVRNSDAEKRVISSSKSIFNYITKDITPEVSLARVENIGDFGEVTAEQNYIYYILKGFLTLTSKDGETVTLHVGDACYFEKGSTYTFSGDVEALVVNQPAFGT